MKPYGVIYKVTNLINNKIYIGQTIQTLSKRKRTHINDSLNPTCPFHHAIKKYGKENFKWEIIDKAFSFNELNEKEIFWIDFYDCYANPKKGYNALKGGSSLPNSKGEENGRCVITEELAKQIKQDINDGKTVYMIAKERKIKNTIVENIKHEKSWSNLKPLINNEMHEKNKWLKQRIINADIVSILKTEFNKGMTNKQIAKKYKISFSSVNNILNERRWSEVEPRINKELHDENAWLKSKILNEKIVSEIKTKFNNGAKEKEIILEYGIARSTVSKIHLEITWCDVEPKIITNK